MTIENGDPNAPAPTPPVDVPAPSADEISGTPAMNSGNVTLSSEQFEAMIAELRSARAPQLINSRSSQPTVRLSLEQAPKVGDVVRGPDGRPATVLEVFEAERKEKDGTTWTQVHCRIGHFADERTLDAEELGEL